MGGSHQTYMREAIRIAALGTGHVSPNPLVGAVVVKDDVIVGRGWHKNYGGPHAEVHALEEAGELARNATALIESSIGTVVIAVRDPNPKAAGGVEQLRNAGISVITDVESDAAEYQNRAFLHRIKTGTPWVIAKTATSLDGRIATRTGHSQWITGQAARKRGHDIRQFIDAILVGAETVRADDPSLTVRERWNEDLSSLVPAHPLRVIATREGNLPNEARVLDTAHPGETLIVTGEKMSQVRESEFIDSGVDVLRLASDATGKFSIEDLLPMQNASMKFGHSLHQNGLVVSMRRMP